MLLIGCFWFSCFVLLTITTHSTSSTVIQTSLIFMYNTFERHVALENHTIRSMNVTSPWECFRHCAKECRCAAFQVTGDNCELLNARKEGATKLVPRYSTFLYTMQQSLQVNGICMNGCCQSRPCLNGGTCVERCSDVAEPYLCACPMHYGGKQCELFHPRVNSCQVYRELKPTAASGVYNFYTSAVDNFQTYCDFDSEAGKAWTAIESFSLSNKDLYSAEPFYHDYPQNERNFNWDNFRLSLQDTIRIRDNSTHWRVTCNFPSGLTFSDYARASLQDTDILTFVNLDKCQRFEYIFARSIGCSNCKAMLVQKDSQHMHTDSYWSVVNGCDWDPSVGAVIGEDNFGFYNVINPNHKCTANSASTTQWWMGSDI